MKLLKLTGVIEAIDKLDRIKEVVKETHMDYSRKRTNEEITPQLAMLEIKQIIEGSEKE